MCGGVLCVRARVSSVCGGEVTVERVVCDVRCAALQCGVCGRRVLLRGGTAESGCVVDYIVRQCTNHKAVAVVCERA